MCGLETGLGEGLGLEPIVSVLSVTVLRRGAFRDFPQNSTIKNPLSLRGRKVTQL